MCVLGISLGIRTASAEVPASRSALAAARSQLETARAEVERLLRTQRALADALPTEPGQAREAEALLMNEAALEKADARRREAEDGLRRALDVRLAATEEETRALAPLLRIGALENRKSAAARLLAIRDERRALLAERAALAPSADARWGRTKVGVDPLDGPEELREKADFLADAEDKLRGKRVQLLAALDARVRRSRLDRAADRFARGNRLFDEETRPGRVLASPGASALIESENPTRGDSAGAPTSPGVSEGGEFGSDAPGPPNVSPSPTNPQSGGAVDFSADQGDVGRLVTQPPPVAGDPTTSAGGSPSPVPSVTPARSLGDLLDLEPSTWRETGSDEVRALIEALEAAERELSAERRALLERARALGSK